MSANQPPPQSHVLPGWFIWIQRHAALGGLLIAQFLITAAMILKVSVSDPSNYASWTWLDWVNAIGGGLIAVAAAGLALGLSENMAEHFGLGRWVKGLFTLFGMALLVTFDVWAGIAERSQQARPTPADNWLADATGVALFRIVPVSVILIATLHASLLLFFGWSNRPQASESAAEMELRLAKKLRLAQHNQQMNAVRAAGAGSAFRAARLAIKGERTDVLSEDDASASQAESDASTGGKVLAFKAPKKSAKQSGLQWTAPQLQQYVRDTYQREVSLDEVVDAIKFLGKGKRLDGVLGTPYWANIRTAKAWADRQFAQSEMAD